MESENTRLVREGFDALDKGGPEALISLIADDFVVTTPPSLASEPDTYVGPEGVRRYFDSFYEAMDRIEFIPHSFEEVGERVLVDFTLRARGRSTGIEAEQRGFQLWHIRDGQAVRLELFPTEEEAREAAESG
ncbi:MAG: nuclear transport factor 2 family protein [Solirubrobacterales bacterium]